MLRRDLLQLLSGAAAASILAPLNPDQRLGLGRRLHAAISGGPPAMTALDVPHAALVDELADLIIPRTDSPGARDVHVLEFIDRMLAFWDSTEERDRFLAGLDDIEARARGAGADGFAALDPAGKTTLLTALDNATARPRASAEEAWSRLKRMVVYGYFTSREIQQNVLKTAILPGRFDGCVPVGG